MKQKLTFRTRIDYACSTDSLRPAMCHIYCDNGFMVASNGYLIVKVPLSISSIDHEKAKECLDGYFIHPVQYREIIKQDMLQFEKGLIKGTRNVDLCSVKTDFHLQPSGRGKDNLIFPDYQKIMDFKSGSINKIGLNLSKLDIINRVFKGVLDMNFAMIFQARNKAIHIKPLEEEFEGVHAMIMPVILKEDLL